MSEVPEPTALYRVWGDADLLLYIGVSNDFGRRWKEHAKQQPWWDEMKRLTADEWFESRPEAEAAEEAAIKAERPKYNKRHLVPVERKSRKAGTAALPARPAVVPAPAAPVAVLSPAAGGRDDESCKVPYPSSLLSFALPGHDMDGIDLGTPDGRFQAAKAFSAYEKEALGIRARLDRHVAETLEMERDPCLGWAIPALGRKGRRGMGEPYWADETCALYLGDMREVLPALGVTADLIVADPPYGETSLAWDRWPDGWLGVAAEVSRSLWCFGSLRMYLEHAAEFKAAKWKFSQDVIWEKHNGSGSANDRFKRVHEQPTHWYRGRWDDLYHKTPTTPDAVARTVRRKFRPPHWGEINEPAYASKDGGPRLMRSVIPVRSMHGRAIHESEKPVGIVSPLIEYACPPGGLVVVPFAGSGAELEAARLAGRPSVGFELRESCAEKAARRLSQMVLEAM